MARIEKMRKDTPRKRGDTLRRDEMRRDCKERGDEERGDTARSEEKEDKARREDTGQEGLQKRKEEIIFQILDAAFVPDAPPLQKSLWIQNEDCEVLFSVVPNPPVQRLSAHICQLESEPSLLQKD
ncbi:hypothetical protein WMY93_015867 [Mugilogobius chulae]|uniref:Uncharacterized protein n=1 Tax=Mugilogobius chulae TaxID=88201 RepID=A0AAW0NYG6_9GOBI